MVNSNLYVRNKFSEKLAALIGDNLTQSDVAEAVGVSQPTVQRWLKGAVPGALEAVRLARYFRISVEDLMCDEMSVQPQILRDAGPEYLVDDALADVAEMRERIIALDRKLRKMKGKP